MSNKKRFSILAKAARSVGRCFFGCCLGRGRVIDEDESPVAQSPMAYEAANISTCIDIVPYDRYAATPVLQERLSKDKSTAAGSEIVVYRAPSSPPPPPPPPPLTCACTSIIPSAAPLSLPARRLTTTNPSATLPSPPATNAEKLEEFPRSVHLQMLLLAQMDYSCFKMASKMGFLCLATQYLNGSVSQLIPLASDILEDRCSLSSGDREIILDFARTVADDQSYWASNTTNSPLSFVRSEEDLVQAAAFILNLAAGTVPCNDATYELLIVSCDVVADFIDEYHEYLENWEETTTSPLGISPYNVVSDFVVEAVDFLELAKPLWFEREDLAEEVADLREKVAMTREYLEDLRIYYPQRFDLWVQQPGFAFEDGWNSTATPCDFSRPGFDPLPQFYSETYRAPVNFGFTAAAAAANGVSGSTGDFGWNSTRGATPWDFTGTGFDTVPQYSHDSYGTPPNFGFPAPAAAANGVSGFATEAGPSASVPPGFEFPLSAEQILQFVFASDSPASAPAAIPVFQGGPINTGVHRQESDNTSGFSTPPSESGSVFFTDFRNGVNISCAPGETFGI